MKNIFNKANAPYLAVGVLATLTLLASGVFAAAPYIGFLAPVAALSVGLPFIIGCAVFSVVTIALSYAAVSKNKTISEKEAQLADEKSKVEAKGKIISEKDAQLANQAKEIEDKDKIISERDTKIEKDAPKVAIADGAIQLAEGTLMVLFYLQKEQLTVFCILANIFTIIYHQLSQ